jgi:hypothetical protein
MLLRPRNPRLKDAHMGMKRRLKASTINRESGISGTDVATIFCIILQSCYKR